MYLSRAVARSLVDQSSNQFITGGTGEMRHMVKWNKMKNHPNHVQNVQLSVLSSVDR
jgi:hypothetical protein